MNIFKKDKKENIEKDWHHPIPKHDTKIPMPPVKPPKEEKKVNT